MKTSNKVYKLLGVLLFSVLLLTSCNENEGENIILSSLDKSTIEKAPLETQIEYANKHLLDIGKIIIKMNHNEEFKSILYKNIKKKSSSDEISSSILVKDLISDIKAKGSNTFFINEEDKMNLQQSLEAFYDLEGLDWHPEIIITNFEEKYKRFSSLVANKSSSSKSKPLIVPVVFEDDNENTEDAYDAYQEDDNGDLQPTGFKVTQSDAKTKEIIFLKISDSCEAMQQQRNSEYDIADCDGGGGGGNSYKNNLYLDRMTVKHFKGAVGRPFVHVSAISMTINSNWTGFDDFAKHFRPMKTHSKSFEYQRRWVRKEKSRIQNELYYENDPTMQGTKLYYDLIIYESDAWPAPLNEELESITVTKPSTGKNIILSSKRAYRSWQSVYDRQLKEGNSKPPSLTINKNSIKYNFKYK